MRTRDLLVFVVVLGLAPLVPPPVHGQMVVSPDEISRALVVRNLKVEDDTVSGVLINKTTLPLAQIRLLIRHTFLWKKEKAPGSENPSRAVFFDVPGTVPPAGVIAFTYKPNPPLPKRKDGHFETTVEVVGFVEAPGGLPEEEE